MNDWCLKLVQDVYYSDYTRMREHTLRMPFVIILLAACTAAPAAPVEAIPASPAFYAVRTDPPALLRFSGDLRVSAEVPFSLPADCALDGVHPAPEDPRLVVELDCGGRALVQLVDPSTGASRTLLPEGASDVQFLGWESEGGVRPVVYLKVNAPDGWRVYGAGMGPGAFVALDNFPPFVYHLDRTPGKMLYALSRGLGYGSELWTAGPRMQDPRQVWKDPNGIATFARWSPDGTRIAFIAMPDSQTPFPPGQLWVMAADGGNPHRLAAADAGHGYAPAWSPDGRRIAFVVRENPDEPAADRFAANLVSNLYVYDLESGALKPVTRFPSAIVESPAWSPDGRSLAFDVRTDDTIRVWLYDVSSDSLRALDDTSMCCPFWLPGK